MSKRMKKKDVELNEVRVIKAPENTEGENKAIFLAGSIEMGKAIDWQSEIENKLKDFDVTLFNPRRDDWDSSWEQSIDNKEFKEQVVWELDSLDKSEKIVFFMDKDTKSPITLLELGLYANSGKCCVYCPDGFWKKGNVDIVCERFSIPMVDSIDELVKFIKND
jgi:hypothetical protein